jgi:hypothetical protein
MKADYKRRLEMLIRVKQYRTDSELIFNQRTTQLFDQVDTIIDRMNASHTEQVFGRGTFLSGTDARAHIAGELYELLVSIRKTARVLKRSEYPGIAEQCRLPKSESYAALRATALAVAQAIEPVLAAFVEREYPADLIEQISALVVALDDATGRKSEGLNGQVAATAGIKHYAEQATIVVAELDAIISKKLAKTDPTLLAVWNHASHIERAPQRAKVDSISGEDFANAESAVVHRAPQTLDQQKGEVGSSDVSQDARAPEFHSELSRASLTETSLGDS